ncbi:hypothetical protein TWF106_009614 [Orbilia oligospora]|uniref:Amidase domain-containing protein n=2 Tax=Orbilia oligospora TaxID=2813651 RepID=A0A6G1MJQ1_ORBOL|nr:hypothetical protein TWF788_001279 [Orbilia oligospora]KAF3205201.1 hypothetical protein TWF679_009424 [Orbilia oligospora]KAF3213038.1 hypothetical protein TWF106_009614 [Orbilia oligospora]KAF3259637.1 hypothetical protein TWF192_010494 [Orbilia oligospora]
MSSHLLERWSLTFFFLLGLLSMATASPVGPRSCKINPADLPDLIDITIDEISTYLRDGCFSSYQLTSAYIARIRQVNCTFHAVQEINPDALDIAKALDSERSRGKIRGPLHGVPILLKDNIATLDKLNTTAGSYALVGAKVKRDSTVAAKLRSAGAIVLGKVGLSQWSNHRSSNSTPGWSSRHGQITSGYYPGLRPEGSSSGSAVATDLGLALGALGTDTSGSIVTPAWRNNLVGIRPTMGLTSRALVIPISERQDSIGPMARTVKDTAYILSAIAGKCSADNYTSAIPFDKIPEYWRDLNKDSLRGAKIGIPSAVIKDIMNSTDPFRVEFEKAVDIIRDLGATIHENREFTDYEDYKAFTLNFTLYSICGMEFKTNIKKYLNDLAVNPNNIKDASGLINYTRSDSREEYPNRNVFLWEADTEKLPCEDNTCKVAWDLTQLRYRLGGEGGILGALASAGGPDGLDALIVPAHYAPVDIAAIAGLPVVTVPLGFRSNDTAVEKDERGVVTTAPNEPFGLLFIGKAWDDQKLLNFAYAFEQKTQVRKNGPKQYKRPTAQIKDFL